MLKKKKSIFSAKKYSNPFFVKRRKIKRFSGIKPGLNWKNKIVIIILLVLVFGLLGFYYFSSFFYIRHINIRGNQKVAGSDIENLVLEQSENKRFWLGSQKNINLLRVDKISDKLSNMYYFEKLSIDKDWPGTLNINIEERKYSLIWLEGEKYYYVDNNGNIFSEADPLEIELEAYPLVENLREARTDGITVNISKETLNYILNLFNIFKERYNEIKIDRFRVDYDANTVKMAILNGPSIYFDDTKDVEEQISKLMVIIKEKLKNDFNNKQYIDLRHGDRVYYR